MVKIADLGKENRRILQIGRHANVVAAGQRQVLELFEFAHDRDGLGGELGAVGEIELEQVRTASD